MTKKIFERNKRCFPSFKKSECEVIEETVNLLLENLFEPCTDKRAESDIDWVADERKVKLYGLDKEPINWGDLGVAKVIEVNKQAYSHIVTIEEAAPGCPNLCAYVERFMAQWGWKIDARTEW